MASGKRKRVSAGLGRDPVDIRNRMPPGGAGCATDIGLVLLGTLWIVGAHAAVIWYNRGCESPIVGLDESMGGSLLLAGLFFATWIVMITYVFLSARQLYRFRSRRLLTTTALVIGALLLTWGYLALAIPQSMHPLYFDIACGGEHPPRWPPIPVPKPD